MRGLRTLKLAILALGIVGTTLPAPALNINLFGYTNQVWKYWTNSPDSPVTDRSFKESTFDDSSWPSGLGFFGFETTPALYVQYGNFQTYIPNPLATPAPNVLLSTFFRTSFVFTNDPSNVTLIMSNLIDDGAVFFLNGQEVGRVRYDDGTQLAANPPVEGAVDLITFTNGNPTSILRKGTNYLAVELHQSGTASSDDVFSMALAAVVPQPPTIIDSSQPTNRTSLEHRRITFVSSVSASPLVTNQWYFKPIGGASFSPIPNGRLASFTILDSKTTDSGDYFLRVSNPLGSIDTRTSRLIVSNDDVKPTVVRAFGGSSLNTITVEFSEAVDPGIAGDIFSYSISGGLNVSTDPNTPIVISPDGKSVILTTDAAQTENTEYMVTLINFVDLAGNPLAGSDTVSFTSLSSDACGGLIFESYTIPPGTVDTIEGFIGISDFPNKPAHRSVIRNVFDSEEAWANLGIADTADPAREAYGSRTRGYFIPPFSGAWVFYIASSDYAKLYFNPAGPDPSGKIQILYGAIKDIDYTNYVSQPFNLIGGQPYYIEALQKEVTGSDYVRVAARAVGQADPTGFGADQAAPGAWFGAPAAPLGILGAVTITQQPVDAQGVQNQSATFTVAATAPSNAIICYQWQKDGIDIPGAVSATYDTGSLTLGDDNTTITAVVSILGNKVTSSSAKLSVGQDLTPPKCLTARVTLDGTNVVVTFNERLDQGTAEDTFSYSIPGYTIVKASLNTNNQNQVVLNLSAPIPVGASVTLTVINVNDLALNAITTPCVIDFHGLDIIPGKVTFETFNTGGGNTVANLTSHPDFPNSPRETFLLDHFDTRLAYPDDSHEGYGGRLTGFFIPPTSGTWIFFLRSDDSSELWFNPDGSDGTAAQKITEETACCNAFSNHTSVGYALTAGSRYFIQALYKEGTGGDFCQVAAKSIDDDSTPLPIPPSQLATLGTLTVTQPTLAIAASGVDKVVLSWQTAPGFHLQSSPTVGAAAAWVDVPNSSASPVTLTIQAGANTFYRLASP